MTTDNKTLADVQPGGRVRLGDHLPPLPPEVDAVRCMIRGEEDMAEACDYYYTADQMRDYARAALSERIGQDDTLTDAARSAIPFVAYAFSEGVTGAEEAGRAIEAALAAQPSPGGQGDALELLEAYDQAVEELSAERSEGWNEDNRRPQLEADVAELRAELIAALASRQPVTMDDALAAGDGTLHGAIDHWQERALRAEAELAARQPVGQEPVAYGVPDARGGVKFGKGWAFTKQAEQSLGATMPLYAAPPAQAVDLGQFRPAVECWRWTKAVAVNSGELDTEMKRSALFEVNEADRLLALIDSQDRPNG